jgi:transcription elongation factor GreA
MDRKWGRGRMAAHAPVGEGVQDAAQPCAAPVISLPEGAVVSAHDQLRSITREGYERLQAQLDELVTVQRPELASRLRDARDGGGGPDANSDHAEALEEHALLERQIALLRQTLAHARVIERDADGTAGIGAYVRLRMPNGASLRVQLVGTAEVDPGEGRISIGSPVGEAILGRRHGDVVDVEAPRGTQRVEILEIESPSAGALAA